MKHKSISRTSFHEKVYMKKNILIGVLGLEHLLVYSSI